MRDGWTLRRPLMTAGLIAFGVTLCCLWAPWYGGFAVAAAAVVASLCLLRRPQALFCVVCCGVFALSVSVYRVQQVEPAAAFVHQEDTLTGRVVEGDGHWYLLQVSASQCLSSGSRVLLYADDLCTPAVGDRVQVSVEYRSLGSAQQYRRADGVHLTAYPTGYEEEKVTVFPSEKTSLFLSAKTALADTLSRRLPFEEGDVLAAMCLGDKTGLSETVKSDFRAAGMSHLLVVSGLHLMIICGSALALLRLCRLRRQVAVGVTMAVTVLFMVFIGLTPSVVRAGVMCLVMLTGSLFRRPADPLNSMGLALMLLLLYNPYMVTDVGLLLSFTATGGVVVLAPPVYARMTAFCGAGRGLRGVAAGFWKSAAAGLSACVGAVVPTMPLSAGVFGSVAVAAPVANLLAVIPAGWSLTVGWAGLLIGGIPLPVTAWLGEGLLLMAAIPVRFVLWVARAVASWDGLVYLPYTWQVAVLTALCGGTALLIRRPSYVRLRAVALFLVLTVTAGGIGVLTERDVTDVWVYPTSYGAAVLVRQEGHTAVLVTHGSGLYEGARMAQTAGVRKADALAVGEYAASDEGRLTQLKRNVNPTAVYAAVGEDDAVWTLWEGATLSVAAERWVLTVEGRRLTLSLDEGRVLVSGTGLVPREAEGRRRLTARPKQGWRYARW